MAEDQGDLADKEAPTESVHLGRRDPSGFSRYHFIRKLGSGGIGEVYLAEDVRLERQVAVKLLTSEVADDIDSRRRFRREAKAASALNHPNVCIIHEVGETEDRRLYIVMEHVDGETLAFRLRQRQMEVGTIIEIAIQTAAALVAAHEKGLIHRDIKPTNICVNSIGQVKVLDFGLAKQVGDEVRTDSAGIPQPPTRTGQVVGTPHYMSPEQTLGQAVDHRSDLFSFGAVLYELVTGQRAFPGSSFGEVAERIVHRHPEAMARFHYEVPIELEWIVRKALEKSPERRYQAAQELLTDLQNLRRDFEQGELGSSATAASELSSFVGEVGTMAVAPQTVESIRHAVELDNPESLSESDVYISYAPLDDQPLPRNQEGWVSRFHRNLEVLTAQLFGQPVKLWRRPNRGGQLDPDPRVLRALPDAKTMVSVVSPSFINTDGCRQEVAQFCTSAEQAGNLWVANRSRILNLVKTPVERQEIPTELKPLFTSSSAFEFFRREPETGRIREFDESYGETARQYFYERVYDVAYEICQVLKSYRSPAPSSAAGANAKTIFLAVTSSDLEPERDRLRRELIEQGHTVIPNQPLPENLTEFESAVQSCLDECDLAIHIVGEQYGAIPQGAEESVVAIQHRLAAYHSLPPPLGRLIWMPRNLAPADSQQADFVQAIIESPEAHSGTEVIQGSLERLKTHVEKKLAPKTSAEPDFRTASVESSVACVYLLYDSVDEEAVEPIEQYLFDHGIEVLSPGFEAEESEAAQLHQRNLQDCDAVLIYYGAVRRQWVEIKLREVLKVTGYGRPNPIALKAVFVAPPADSRKRRFRTHIAEIIRQEGTAFDPEKIASFGDRIKALKRGGQDPVTLSGT